MLVGSGRFSGSHQGLGNDIHHFSAYSELVPVMRLGPLFKRLRTYCGQMLLTWDPQTSKDCPRKTASWANTSFYQATKRTSGDACVRLGRVPGSYQGGVSSIYQANEDSYLVMGEGRGHNTGKRGPAFQLHEKRAQQRDSGGYSSSPCPESTQLSLSRYVSGISRASVPLMEPRVSA